jgi:hypothetical protein
VERGNRFRNAALFAQDVTFHTPILTDVLNGRELTLKFVGQAAHINKDLI